MRQTDANELFSRLDGPLLRVFRSIRLLGSVSPTNAAAERRRLIESFERGRAAGPRWTYERRDMSEAWETARAALRAIGTTPSTPLRDAYVARVAEMTIEISLASEAGSKAFAPHARARFARYGSPSAAALARQWLAEPHGAQPEESIQSDGDDPRSLLSQMRKAVGERMLPFRVSAHPSLAALAATGEETIVVASGRMISAVDVARTVVHEISGHAEPRARARTSALGLLHIGTANGSDAQEGLAMVFEKRANLLDCGRKRQLAARHLAATWMDDGASFSEVVTRLLRDHGFAPRTAVPLAERAFRGGDGEARGLGRDVVYLGTFEQVERAIDHGDEAVLSCGQVAPEWASLLRPFLNTP